MHKKHHLLIVLFLVISFVQADAQEWIVPEEESGLVNPQEYNLDNVKRGKELYLLNCKSCHGDVGKNNALPLVPPPPDVASEIMLANSEGDLFHKISIGRGGMPQFATVISEDDRWRLVNFIMNYSSKTMALLSELPPVKAILTAVANVENRAVEVSAQFMNKAGEYVSLTNASLQFFNQKTFGQLPIGELMTDAEGKAVFTVPENLIGDEQGLLNLLVDLNDDFDVSPFMLNGVALGVAKEHTPLIQKGVLWSTNDNMPMWLVISFFGLVAAAWLTIGYVVLQIVKIRKYAKEG